MAKTSTSFKRGHKFGRGSNGQLRRDLTIELISQLNEFDSLNYTGVGPKRDNLHRIVENLVLQAKGQDQIESGKVVKRERGDLAAIREIFDRLEGKPRQKVEVKEEEPEQEFHTLEEVRTYLLEFGIDIAKLPNPMVYLEDKSS
jgi:hypothetical protein